MSRIDRYITALQIMAVMFFVAGYLRLFTFTPGELICNGLGLFGLSLILSGMRRTR